MVLFVPIGVLNVERSTQPLTLLGERWILIAENTYMGKQMQVPFGEIQLALPTQVKLTV